MDDVELLRGWAYEDGGGEQEEEGDKCDKELLGCSASRYGMLRYWVILCWQSLGCTEKKAAVKRKESIRE